MDQQLLPLATGPTPRRRGRPPGARNKRSGDLAKYVEAQFGGMTPGQQSAALALVTARDLKAAKADARELGLDGLGLSDLTLAMVVKAKRLAAALGIETAGAWLLLQKEREALMPYVHQRQPQAEPVKDPAGSRATVFVIQEGEAGGALSMDDDDEQISFIDVDGVEVSPAKSHGEPETEA